LRPPWGEAKLKVELSAVSISRSNFSGNSASTGTAMTKSELIERIAGKQTQLSAKDVELAVKGVLETMSQVLAEGGRIEIRGFGSFSLHYRPARIGRNPKTGDPVALSGKYVPHFKPGKDLKLQVNNGKDQIIDG